MTPITDTDRLARLCAEGRAAPYVTLDTEFLRERTYWSRLCLVQMALPGAEGAAVLIDPLAAGLSLEPLYDLFRHRDTVKVFHAARQDLEIFFHDAGLFPEPLFDTQVAAMVCGFGEQAGYETLVRRIARASLDKTSRFTDWSQRPLSEAQMTYALADVTHLRRIYEHLAADLDRRGRRDWVEDELAGLTDPATYATDPDRAWERVRTRSGSPRFLAVVRELAAFRERHAQARDIPRSRVFKDEVLLELASTRPVTVEDLGRSRLLQREARRGEIAEGIMAAVRAALALPAEALPSAPDGGGAGGANGAGGALADLLRVLLKAKAEAAGVAPRLIASSAELDAIAAGERDTTALRGWRGEVFGAEALRLCAGEVALSAAGGSVRVVALGPPAAATGGGVSGG
ncbi:MAG: ribonuclease D [Rhodobacteraceae bacterium]|nr:ribonuclease D [Paracoccaceae bacterium]